MDQKCFSTKFFLSPKMFFDQQLFQLKFWFGFGKLGFGFIFILGDQHFFNRVFLEENFFGIMIFVGTNSFREQNFGDQFYFGNKFYFLA